MTKSPENVYRYFINVDVIGFLYMYKNRTFMIFAEKISN